MDKSGILFVIKVFAVTFSLVALYVLITYPFIYWFIKAKGGERVLPLVKRIAVKFPFVITGYGFAAGLFGYLWGVFVVGGLFGKASHVSAPSDFNHPSGPQIALVIFTLVGFCMSVAAEFMTLSKIYRALHVPPESDANVSTDSRRDTGYNDK